MTIDRQSAIDLLDNLIGMVDDNHGSDYDAALRMGIDALKAAEPVRCKDCKHNPKYEWFGCPMSHLSEAQRPETAWCWKGERRTDAETEV